VPTLFNNIKTLKQLNLSNNLITDWTDLNDFQIKMLDLSHNTLVEVRLHLLCIEECDMGYNHITTIDLVTPLIKKLELQNNHLVQVPESVLVLDRLNYLGLQSNRLDDLDNRLSVLTNLAVINFRGNPMTRVPLEIQTSETIRVKLYLEERVHNIDTYLKPVKLSVQEFNGHRITDGYLDLSKQPLRELDPKLLTIGIIVLDLSFTKIPFPLELSQLVSLKTLKFNGNGLRELPPISLTITTLELCQNSLTKVHIDWPTLTSLNLNYN
jgi:Leucine-rich repeat (LRR) protein